MQDNLREFMRRCKKDSRFFVNSLLNKKTRGVVDGVRMRHAGQETWLEKSTEAINVLVPANRWGKSTIEGMKHLWKAFVKDGVRIPQGSSWMQAEYQTISVAMSADQAGIVYQEVKRLARSPAFAPFVVRTRETPFPHVVLWNGSVIHCRSAHDDGKYIDGHGYQYVSVDEAGWIRTLKKLMNEVLLMRLAGGGDIDLVGTPKGFGDLYWYYERGARKIPGYYSQKGSIFDNPFLPPEDIKMRDELLRSSDPKLRMQVMYGEFVDFAGLAFTHDQRDNSFRASLPAHQDREDGHRYVQAWDLGRVTDYTVGITLDITRRPFILVDYMRLNKVPWEEIYRLIDAKAKEYGVLMPRIDATGPGGDVIEEELWKRNIAVDAFKTSTRNEKVELINNLQSAFDYGRGSIGEKMEPDEAGVLHYVPVMEEPDPDGDGWGLLRLPTIPQLMDELGTYMMNDKDITQDSVMALALVTDLAYSGEFVGQAVEGGVYG